MNLGNDNALWLLFAVPLVLAPAYVWCFWRKARTLRVLASNEMLPKINNTVSLGKQIFKAGLLIAAFVCIVVALTEPKWNPQPQQIRRKGRDVVILLDTSRSMLAEDITPNRLERSKIAISDLLEVLKGDRIAHHHVCRHRHGEMPADAGLRVRSDGPGGYLDREHQPGRNHDRRRHSQGRRGGVRQAEPPVQGSDSDHRRRGPRQLPRPGGPEGGRGRRPDHRHRPGRRRDRLAHPDHRAQRREDLSEVPGPGGLVQARQRHAPRGGLRDRGRQVPVGLARHDAGPGPDLRGPDRLGRGTRAGVDDDDEV